MGDSPLGSADLDLALVRSFTVVAEHRHFGRAAAALHITPSSLSRQITRLERQVGARLLDRTPQRSQLTEAGQVFLPLAEDALRAAQAAARARAAARPSVITIGFIMNIVVTPAVRELRRQYPDADVRTRYLQWNEVQTALLEHQVDAAVSRLPFPTDQLDVTILYDEPRVLVVPADHRLAPDGPLVTTAEDKIELIAGGQAVAIIPATAFVGSVRPDLVAIPLDGVEPSHVALATRVGDRGRLVSAFRKCARSHLARSLPAAATEPAAGSQ